MFVRMKSVFGFLVFRQNNDLQWFRRHFDTTQLLQKLKNDFFISFVAKKVWSSHV